MRSLATLVALTSTVALVACSGAQPPDKTSTLIDADADADADADSDADTDADADADTDSDTDADTGDTGATATGDTGGADLIAIAGTYVDQWATAHDIGDVAWVQTYYGYAPWTFHVSQFDNTGRWVVAQNDGGNPYSAGLWSRFDWVESGGKLYYCQSAFDLASEADALARPRPDDSSPSTGGCGPFPWTDLTP